MTVKKKQRIGFDPLAWMKENGESPVARQELSEAPLQPSTTGERADQVIILGEALTIAHIRRMHEALGQALAQAVGGTLTLDGSQVEEVDTAGMQLLAVFVRTLKTRGLTLSWRNVPVTLRECARRLGLSEALHL